MLSLTAMVITPTTTKREKKHAIVADNIFFEYFYNCKSDTIKI
jgi:hypothetical protein